MEGIAIETNNVVKCGDNLMSLVNIYRNDYNIRTIKIVHLFYGKIWYYLV